MYDIVRDSKLAKEAIETMSKTAEDICDYLRTIKQAHKNKSLSRQTINCLKAVNKSVRGRITKANEVEFPVHCKNVPRSYSTTFRALQQMSRRDVAEYTKIYDKTVIKHF